MASLPVDSASSCTQSGCTLNEAGESFRHRTEVLHKAIMSSGDRACLVSDCGRLSLQFWRHWRPLISG